MTESNSSLNEVPALIEERRRYEGWLLALDARRDSTPAHVFERVQADYMGRLQRVAEQLATFRQAIDTERANTQSRLSLLEAEEQLRRDERAELELRVHVGELAGDDANRAFETVDESITRLVGEKGTLQERVTELQSLLEEEARPAVDAAAPEAGGSAASTAEVQPAEVQPEPAAQAQQAPPAPPPVPQPAPAAPPAQPQPAVARAPQPQVPAQSAAGATAHPAPAASAQPQAPAAKPAGSGPEAEPDAAPPPPAGGSFDELAFLSSIVGQSADGSLAQPQPEPALTAPVPGPGREPQGAESLLAGVEHTKLGAGQLPLAANVAGNTPIVLRTSSVTEQVKTLKCTECGSMNYPTEWYCERCGAELAAL